MTRTFLNMAFASSAMSLALVAGFSSAVAYGSTLRLNLDNSGPAPHSGIAAKPSGPLPHAGPPVSHLGGSLSGIKPQDSIANCAGTNWETDANAIWQGGAYGFLIDLQDIGYWYADNVPGFSYMATEVSNSTYWNAFGEIACRESTFNQTANNGQYWGLFQLSYGDFSNFFTGCDTTYLYEEVGCGGFATWQVQMLTALYYCEYQYGGNPVLGWNSEVYNNYW